MEFSEKLDFLMSITKTTNSTIDHYISLDASYINGFRNKKRKLPKSENHIEKMASRRML